MIKLPTLVLFYFLSLSMGFLSNIDPKIVNENRNKYPWMVIIYNLSELSGVVDYGTIIHERVILTLANPTIEKFGKLGFQVLPDIYINKIYHKDDKKEIPVGLKQIKEYHQIEYGSHKNLELLILKEPLQLSNTINVITLFRENDQFDPHNCILLRIYGEIIFISKSTTNLVVFITSFAVKLNQAHLDVVTSPNDRCVPLDEQGRISPEQKDNLIKGIHFTGGPLYCKSKNTEKWGQLGVTDLLMKIEGKDNPKLTIKGNIIRIDNNTIHNVINEVLKTSDINDFKLNNDISRY